MNSKISIVLLLAMVCTAFAIVCPPNYCERVDCSNSIQKNECQQNQNGIFEEHGTFCGCCPACLIKLTKGENCRITMIMGMPAKAKCDSGLKCDYNKGICVAE